MSWSEKIYGGIGWVAGGTLNLAINGVGLVAKATAATPAEGIARAEKFKIAGQMVHDGATIGGKFVGRTVNTVSEYAGKAGGATAGFVAEVAGANENVVRNAKIAGTVVGSAGIGILAGDLVMGSVVGTIGAVSGLHGAAAIAHGEKVIGSIVGGGQAAGKAVIATVDATSAVTTAKDGAIGSK